MVAARVYYGWVIVAICAVTLAATSGARFSFGVFLKPIADANDWDRASLSFAITLNLILGGLLQPLAGAIVDRYGARLIGTLGALVLGIGFLGLSVADQLWQYYLLYGVISGIGVAATSTVLSAKLIATWFVEKRGTALSMASSGNAIGQLLIVPFATWLLISRGFATGFVAVGAIALCIVTPLYWLFVRDRPRTGETETTTSLRSPIDADGLPVRAVFAHPVFWQLTFGLTVCGITMAFPSTHLMPYAMDMHMPEMVAGAALGLAGGLSFPAALAVGWLADRFGRGRVLAVVYALRGLTFVVLLFATTEAMWFLAAIALGLSWTGTVPLSTAIAADYFGRKHLGLISGLMVMAMWVASGVAAFIAGFIYDHSQSYDMALVGNAFLGLAATVVSLGIARERLTPRAPTPVTSRGVS